MIPPVIRSDLEWSLSVSNQLPWIQIFREVYPDILDYCALSEDSLLQRKGTDGMIRLPRTGVLVSEKIRRPRWTGADILLEIAHDFPDGRRKRGWAVQEEHCDLIACVYTGPETCHLIPRSQLTEAWEKYRNQWWKRYARINARNPTSGKEPVKFWTRGVAVPAEVLRSAVPGMTTVQYRGLAS